LLYLYVSGNFYEYFIIIYLLSFHSESNLDQLYQSMLLLIVFQCMSPMRYEYSKLSLKLVSLEENCSRTPKKTSIEVEKKNDREKYYTNLLLEQTLVRYRDEMMENFAHILQFLPISIDTYSSRGHFGGTSPFKLEVNFDIPIFEG
jgi:hypothetical protein